MKIIFLILFFTFQQTGFADDQILQGVAKYEKLEQPYATGRVNPTETQIPTAEFIKAGASVPATFDLRNFAELTPIKDQGNCGSCVYFAVTALVEDEYRLRGAPTSILSPQYTMDCSAREWMCEGSFFSKVAEGIQKKGGAAKLSEYPYTAKNQSCKSGQFALEGAIKSYKIIDNSPQSIIGALNEFHPVATTIGAGGSMMSYKGGGTMKSCQNIGTNHEMVIVGYSCGKSVDASGNCAFDASGQLVGKASSKGVWIIRNSWGLGYGEKGYLYISMYNAQGKLCNNVTEEVGVVETVACTPQPKAIAGEDKNIILKGN